MLWMLASIFFACYYFACENVAILIASGLFAIAGSLSSIANKIK